jgi:hypothetical protein
MVTVVASNGAGATCELRVALYRSGCIQQRWTIEQADDVLRIRGESVGIVLVISRTRKEFAPLNPATDTEYFRILSADLEFALERLGGVVCFETAPELAPLNPHESAELEVRIDAARSRLAQAKYELRQLEIEKVAGFAAGEWRVSAPKAADAEADQVHTRINESLAAVQAPASVELAADRTLELRVEIGGFEGVTVCVDHIAPADFGAVCRSVRAAFLADKA